MISKLRQLGQGMTEYIIIVALIAIAAIAVYGFFGDAIRGQVGAMTQELAGEQADMGAVDTAKGGATGEASQARGLNNYGGN
jgi:type IV pilus assembly protein PilA